MGMTIAEKILARHAGRDVVKPGEYVWCDVDGTGLIGPPSGLEALGVEKVYDPEKVWMVDDHFAPAPTPARAQTTKEMRRLAEKYQLNHWFEYGRHGILHQLFPENGYCVPGDLIVSIDSHSTSYGCFNAMGVPIMEELTYVVVTGRLWMRVPETIRFNIVGKLPEWCVGKDIILKIAGDYGTDCAIYKSIEFGGPVVSQLSLGSRFSMSNMGVELGAKCAIFECDDVTLEWLKGRIWREPNPASPDPDAVYEAVYDVDVTGMAPQVACPHDPGNVKPADEVEAMRVRVDQAFLGSCTNGRTEDYAMAAKVLKGKKIAPWVRCIVTPASQAIWLECAKNGIWETLAEAGCMITASTCGPCAGAHQGLLGDGEVCIGTNNRNFQGRMGSPESLVYLASPATVAASALTGYVTDPRPYL
ncbi:MAG TPA: 3-isopropylmalate dehydratase large subunit [Dehalococcoidia bacterium]|nr:3-isopropylmalate dehydratase large subunit [Dehalococcoidia bacterium]